MTRFEEVPFSVRRTEMNGETIVYRAFEHIVTVEHENKAETTEILIRALSGRQGISLSVSSIRVFFGVIEKSFGDTPTLA